MANYQINLSRREKSVRLTRQDIHKTIHLKRSSRSVVMRSSGLRGQRGKDGAGPESLAQVAFTGEYADLLNTPVIPDVSGKADKAYVDAQDAQVASSAQAALVVHTSRTDNPHSVTKGQVGLGNVDNTSDLGKPVSSATQSALDTKVDQVLGKGLSTEDYTTAEKTKLAGIAAGATQNASDASLRDRSTHTGTQAISTITGLQTTLDGKTSPADVSTAINAVVDSAPGTLDTLNELAAALGDDPNFATTVASQIGAKADSSALDAHVTDINNPHQVTKAQVGLGNVDNTSDANKPVSTAQQAALDNRVVVNTGVNMVYATGNLGEPIMRGYSSGTNNSGTVVYRGTAGRTVVGTPDGTNLNHAVNVTYLNDQIATRQTVFRKGTVATASATAAKTVTLDPPYDTYTPAPGDYFQITYTLGSVVSSATLAVNGGTAYPINSPDGGTSNLSTRAAAGYPILYVFNGSRFITQGSSRNDTYAEITALSIVNASDSTGSLITGRRAEDLMVHEASEPRTLINKTIAAGSNSITGLGVAALGGITGTPSASTYLRGDGVWATPVGGGSGIVNSVVAGSNIDVDSTDPANPVVSVETLTLSDITDVTASAVELNYVDGVTSAVQAQIDSKQMRFMKGTVSTATGTAAKTVTLDSPWSTVVPTAGDMFLLTFTNGHNITTPTIAINGTTARPMRTLAGQVNGNNTSIASGGTVLLYFDGTIYFMQGATANTTYAESTDAEIINTASTTARLITGQRAETLMLNESTKVRTLTNKDLTSPSNTFPMLNQNTTGNAATATKLLTGRTINGVSFDGTTNITVTDSTKEPLIASGTTGQYYRGDKTFQTLNQDVVPDGTTNKAFLATERTKLSGIATGATVNDTDANLKNRANHTGTQPASSVTGLATVATSGAYADLTGKPVIPDELTDLDTTVTGSQLNAVKTKVDGIATGADVTAATNVSSAGGLIYVNHGSTAGTARPSVSGAVFWIGAVEPTNAVNGDVWLDL